MSFGSSGVHGIAAAYSLLPGYTQVAVNGDGQIFVGTAITTAGSGHTAATVSMKVLEFDADGSADTSFGTSGIATTGTISGDGSGLILQIQLNGQIVVGFGGTGGGGHFVLARFNGSGGLDSTFGSSGIEVGAAEGGGLAMVTASNGETVLIGKVSSGNGIILQEFGTLAKTFTYYVEYDADDNVTSITDSSGNVLERYSTDPYGNVTVLNPNGTVRGDGTAASSFFAWDYFYQGLQFSVMTGLYYNRNRQTLDPARGQYLQPDPNGGRYVNGLNLYQDRVNNPLNYLDASGESVTIGQVAGGAAGGAVGGYLGRAVGGVVGGAIGGVIGGLLGGAEGTAIGPEGVPIVGAIEACVGRRIGSKWGTGIGGFVGSAAGKYIAGNWNTWFPPAPPPAPQPSDPVSLQLQAESQILIDRTEHPAVCPTPNPNSIDRTRALMIQRLHAQAASMKPNP